MAIQSKTKSSFVSRYNKPIVNRLTPSQLSDLDKRLQNYKRKVKAVEFGGLSLPENVMIDTRAYCEAMGALKNGAIVIKEITREQDGGKERFDCSPILYEQLQEDLAQWGRWNYGRLKQTQQYEHIS